MTVLAPARRPWWKKKRWAAALLLWLAALYPAALGPAFYFAGLGWLPEGAVEEAFRPLFSDLAEDYGEWCYRLGKRHAASD